MTRPPTAHPARLHGLPVLVVDDNATNRRILEEVLRNWRHAAADGGRRRGGAGRAASRRPPAASRFRWCCSTGRCRRWTASRWPERSDRAPDTGRTAVMMLTSAGQPEDVGRCRELGIAAYLTKPVKQSELLDAILAALGQASRYMPSRRRGRRWPRASAAAARPAGRGQPGQSEAGGAPAGEARPRRRGGRQRPARRWPRWDGSRSTWC